MPCPPASGPAATAWTMPPISRSSPSWAVDVSDRPLQQPLPVGQPPSTCTRTPTGCFPPSAPNPLGKQMLPVSFRVHPGWLQLLIPGPKETIHIKPGIQFCAAVPVPPSLSAPAPNSWHVCPHTCRDSSPKTVRPDPIPPLQTFQKAATTRGERVRFPWDVPSLVLSSLCPGASQAEEREQSTGGYHRVNLVIARLSRHDLDRGSLSCCTVVNPGPRAMQVAELRHSSPGSHGHHGLEGTALPGGGGDGDAFPAAACQ